MIFSNPKKTQCPSCHGESTLRSSRARNTKEKIIKAITWFELYRCKTCGWRGWNSNIRLELKAVKKIIYYALLMILAAFVVYNFLKILV